MTIQDIIAELSAKQVSPEVILHVVELDKVHQVYKRQRAYQRSWMKEHRSKQASSER